MSERRDPDALRRRAGARGDPARDQHFLVDDRVLDGLPEYAVEAVRASSNDAAEPLPNPGDTDTTTERQLGHVLEIGAGTGALTDRLLGGADHVTAIERDASLAAFLETEFSDAIATGRLDVVQGDALDVDLPDFDTSVSNLPYGASSELVFRLLPAGRPTVLMVQREFGERMAAGPSEAEYGRLSVTAGHYADVEVLEIVPPTAFDPEPAVESAVVGAIPRAPDYAVPDEAFFMDFLRAVFTQRRKTLRNAIRNTAHISGLGDPDAVVAAADDKTMSARAGDLSPAAFAELATLAHDVGDPAHE